MHQCQHAHQSFTGQQRHADGALGPRILDGIVRPLQPAVIPRGIGDQRRFVVGDHPPRQSALHRVAQLLRGVFVELLAVDDGRVHRLAVVVQHHDAGALAAHVTHGLDQHALQHRA